VSAIEKYIVYEQKSKIAKERENSAVTTDASEMSVKNIAQVHKIVIAAIIIPIFPIKPESELLDSSFIAFCGGSSKFPYIKNHSLLLLFVFVPQLEQKRADEIGHKCDKRYGGNVVYNAGEHHAECKNAQPYKPGRR
jgi:hypothetical protein